MQNQLLQFKLLNNTKDVYTAINPTVQQIFMLPIEESQMFPSTDSSNIGTLPSGYTNDPSTMTENRDSKVNAANLPYASSFTPTVYSGMSVYDVPTLIDEEFASIKVYNPKDNTSENLYETEGNNLRIVANGLQMLKIPKNRFNTTLTDEDDIAANNNSTIQENYGKYFLTISPKYVESNVLSIVPKEHYPVEHMADNVDNTDATNIIPKHKRRNIYVCDRSNFLDTPWEFEQERYQAGRLFGSVVEVWNSTRTKLKQVKIMAENNFNWNSDTSELEIVLYPDNFGYNSPNQDIVTGDVLRIYPRETYFNQINIEISYEDEQFQLEQAMAFLMNDVVRDMKTGRFEVYDRNGFTIDETSGNFDGTVVHRYQITQYGNYETRKKLKNNG